jgi:hypothetical protein
MPRRLTETDLDTIHLALMTLADMVAADEDSFEPDEMRRVEVALGKIRERQAK